MTTKNNFSFRSDSPEFIEKIAKKYELSTNGIVEVTNFNDVKQIKRRFEKQLSEKHPGARIMWSPKDNKGVFYVFTNDNLDLFGFTKVVLPAKEEGDDGDIVMTPFILRSPLIKVEELF